MRGAARRYSVVRGVLGDVRFAQIGRWIGRAGARPNHHARLSLQEAQRFAGHEADAAADALLCHDPELGKAPEGKHRSLMRYSVASCNRTRANHWAADQLPRYTLGNA